MSLSARDFTLPGQWAKEANTIIPPIPVSGQTYRNASLAKALIEIGQEYDVVADSAKWNQLLYLMSSLNAENEIYGFCRWSPLTNYVGQGSICLGTDGVPYYALQPSGPGVPAGPQDPTTIPVGTYWVTLAFFLGILPEPTAAQTFYFRNDGNDANDGLSDTPAGAFRTLQGGYSAITTRQTTNQHHVELRITTGGEFGRADGSTVSINPSLLSANVVLLYGNQNTPVISASGINVVGCLHLHGGGNLIIAPTGDRSVPELVFVYAPTSYVTGGIGACIILSEVNLENRSSIEVKLYPDPSITATTRHFSIDHSMLYIGSDETTGSPAQTLLYGKAINEMIAASNSNVVFGSRAPGGVGTNIILQDVTGSATFLHFSTFTSYAQLSNAISFTGDQSGIGWRYFAQIYSGFNTGGGGANFFPGTVAGIVDANSYCYYS